MVPNSLHAFVRRHPAVRQVARQLRSRLPLRLGGVDPLALPPAVRRFDLLLPRRAGAAGGGPDTLRVAVSGDFPLPRTLQRFGLAGYEPEGLACFLTAVEQAGSGAVLDVGANVGPYAALAATRSARRVFAFEPTPALAAACRAVAAGNGLGIETSEVALSNHTGHGALHLAACGDTDNTLAAGLRPTIGRIDIQVDTLARWRERAGVRPAVIKIDTAATEPDVIAGALEVLRRFRPWVFCEVRPGHGLEERLMALLEPVDYGWYPLRGRPPHRRRPAITGVKGAGGHLWMFAPSAPGPRFWAAAREWRTALERCRALPTAAEA